MGWAKFAPLLRPVHVVLAEKVAEDTHIFDATHALMWLPDLFDPGQRSQFESVE